MEGLGGAGAVGAAFSVSRSIPGLAADASAADGLEKVLGNEVPAGLGPAEGPGNASLGKGAEGLVVPSGAGSWGCGAGAGGGWTMAGVLLLTASGAEGAGVDSDGAGVPQAPSHNGSARLAVAAAPSPALRLPALHLAGILAPQSCSGPVD
jgi:hypothetical protein